MSNPMNVIESNAFGTPFDLETMWSGRQERERQRLTDAIRKADQLLAEAADSPTMMVRVVSLEPIMLSELVSSKVIDGITLQSGDYVLLIQQTEVMENGVWIMGTNPSDLKRPPSYLNAPGRQFYITSGTANRGTLFVCTASGASTQIRPALSRPTLRDVREEQSYIGSLDVSARRLAPGTDTKATDDEWNRNYVDSLNVHADTARRLADGVDNLANQTYISSLNVAGRRLVPGANTKTADDDWNRTYVNALNVEAATARRLATATASDSTANQTYINSLDVDAGLAKRARTLATDATASEMVTNGQCVRNMLGVGDRLPVVGVSNDNITTFPIGGTVDGVQVVVGQRWLLRNQTSAVNNGVYIVYLYGNMDRAGDMLSGYHCSGSFVTTTNGRRFMCTAELGSDIVDSHPLNWVQTVYDVPSIRSVMATGHREQVDATTLINVSLNDIQTGNTLGQVYILA